MLRQVENYQLQAYVDGQVSTEERLQIEELMEVDPEVQQAVLQLQEMKSLVKQAYLDVPVPPSGEEKKTTQLGSQRWISVASAASLILGLFIGLSFSFLESGSNFLSAQNPVVAEHQAEKYIVHIDSDQVDKQLKALQEIEALYQQKGDDITVDVISNSDGVKLFDVSNPNSKELESLLDRHTGLSLYACKRALERASKNGKKIEVLKQVKHQKPAVDAMAERLNSGWKYIKI